MNLLGATSSASRQPGAHARRDRPTWVTVTTGAAILDELGDELDHLHQTAATPITARRPWLRLWVRAFSSWEPWAVLVRSPSTGALEGAALLASRRRFGVTELIALGQGPSDYVRFPVSDAEAGERLGHQLALELGSLRGPWRLATSELPEHDPVIAVLAADMPRSRVVPGDPAPATRFSVDRSLNSYTSGKFRNQARRKRAQLSEAAGGVEVRFTTEPAVIAELRPKLEAVRLARDVDQGRLGDLDSSEGSAFWWSVLPALAESGELELATLWAGTDLAAYSVGLLDGASYRSWDFRMSPRWADFNPGQVLDFAVIERVLADERFHELDRMRGEEPYKMRTANVSVPAQRLTAWSSVAIQALEERSRDVKDLVRRSEWVARSWRLARRRARRQLPVSQGAGR